MTNKLEVGSIESKTIHAFEAYDRNDLTEIYKARYPVDGKMYRVKVFSNFTLNNLTIEDIFEEFPPLELFGESVSSVARDYEFVLTVPKPKAEGLLHLQDLYGFAVAKIYGPINPKTVTYYGVDFKISTNIVNRCLRNAVE